VSPRTLAQRALLVALALAAVAGLELAMLRAWDAEAQVQAAQGAEAHAELQQLLLADWRSCTQGLPEHLRAEVCGPAPR
jgi:ferric-dicitrate binding protein FerR (iron transport regulator)